MSTKLRSIKGMVFYNRRRVRLGQRYGRVLYTFCTPVQAQSMQTSSPSEGYRNLELYQKVKGFLRRYVTDLRNEFKGKNGDDLLSIYAQRWSDYPRMDRICGYLNQRWTKQILIQENGSVFIIYNLALVMWREILFGPIQSDVTKSVLELIDRHRRGDSINTSLVNIVIKSYVEMGNIQEVDKITAYTRTAVRASTLKFYREAFEQLFIKNTEYFYNSEADAFLAENPVTEYIKRVEQRLEEEEYRRLMYLDRSTGDALSKCCGDVLIRKRFQLFHSEFKNSLLDDKPEDMARIYNLCSRVDEHLDELCDSLQRYILQQGLSAIEKAGGQALDDPKIYINSILDVHRRYHRLVITAFENDIAFLAALDKACGKFINQNSVTDKAGGTLKSPLFLARYCDAFLRKSAKKPEEAETEDSLNQVMIVFKYIDDKDAFGEFYRKLLAQRLLTQASASDDAEYGMILRLKSGCGLDYTTKLRRMFSDMDSSSTLNERFSEHLRNSGGLDIEFSTLVLTSSYWPLAPQSFTFALPQELAKSIDRFMVFHAEQHSGRKLRWLYDLSKGDILANFYDRKYTFTATTYQMAVLLLFNDQLDYTVQQIFEHTQIKMEILQQVIVQLTKFKLLVLVEESSSAASGSAHDGDIAMTGESKVAVTKSFTNKKLKIDLSKIRLKNVESKREKETLQNSIEKGRECLVQAAIVRIMKMRLHLHHQQLITEVLEQLAARFKPEIGVINKNIIILIDKEYLRRVQNENETYEYLAA